MNAVLIRLTPQELVEFNALRRRVIGATQRSLMITTIDGRRFDSRELEYVKSGRCAVLRAIKTGEYV